MKSQVNQGLFESGVAEISLALAWIIHENAQFSLAPGMPDNFAHRIFYSLGNTVRIPLPRKIPCEQSVHRDNRTFHE